MENKKRVIEAEFAQHIANVELTPDEAGVVQWVLSHTPTIDVEEVVHGRWILSSLSDPWNNWHECSECRTVGSPQWKRCPVCEAKMDGERKDNG